MPMKESVLEKVDCILIKTCAPPTKLVGGVKVLLRTVKPRIKGIEVLAV